MKNKSVLVVGDNSYFRNKIHSFLETACKYTTVVNVERNDNLNDIIQRTQPSVIFIETNYCYEATPYLIADCLSRHKYLKLNIVMWTVEDLTAERAGRFIFLGARGYIDCRHGLELIRSAILDTLNGTDYVPPHIRKAADCLAIPCYEIGKLNNTEIIIIKLLVHGRTPQETAKILKLSYGTIRIYINKIYQKCAIRSKEGLFIFAILTGIVSVNEIRAMTVSSLENSLKDIKKKKRSFDNGIEM
jgi:DNA-binding NarL/FixJ family response regulator